MTQASLNVAAPAATDPEPDFECALHLRVAAVMNEAMGDLLPPKGSKARHEWSLRLARLVNTVLPVRDHLFSPDLREGLQRCWADSEADAGGFSRSWAAEVAIKGTQGIDTETDFELLARIVDTSTPMSVLDSLHVTEHQKEAFWVFLRTERCIEFAKEMVLTDSLAVDRRAATEFFAEVSSRLYDKGMADCYEFATERLKELDEQVAQVSRDDYFS